MTVERPDRSSFLSAFDVSRETLERLDQIVDLLDAWRQKSNLIGPKEWPHIWTRHVGDSFQILDHIPDTARVMDLGSGGGFPGLVVAADRPNGHVTMVESVGKKTNFLLEVVREVGLAASVINQRVESLPPSEADIVTARAFAPLESLLEYASPWMCKGATGVFLKGERWKEELTAAQQKWSFAHKAIPSRSGGSGVILIVGELDNVRG